MGVITDNSFTFITNGKYDHDNVVNTPFPSSHMGMSYEYVKNFRQCERVLAVLYASN